MPGRHSWPSARTSTSTGLFDRIGDPHDLDCALTSAMNDHRPALLLGRDPPGLDFGR